MILWRMDTVFFRDVEITTLESKYLGHEYAASEQQSLGPTQVCLAPKPGLLITFWPLLTLETLRMTDLNFKTNQIIKQVYEDLNDLK